MKIDRAGQHEKWNSARNNKQLYKLCPENLCTPETAKVYIQQ